MGQQQSRNASYSQRSSSVEEGRLYEAQTLGRRDGRGGFNTDHGSQVPNTSVAGWQVPTTGDIAVRTLGMP